jgi:uncharacterized membrane protein YbhN (UPF0104 family)
LRLENTWIFGSCCSNPGVRRSAFALRGIDFAGIQSQLNQTSTSSFFSRMAIAIVVNLIQIAFGAMRWREISGYCQAPLDLPQAFRYDVIGTFFNQTLPSTIGGDAIRLWLLSRTAAGWRAATYSVLVDCAVGLIALALVVVVSLPWSFELIHSDRGRLALVLVDVAAMSAGLTARRRIATRSVWSKRSAGGAKAGGADRRNCLLKCINGIPVWCSIGNQRFGTATRTTFRKSDPP